MQGWVGQKQSHESTEITQRASVPGGDELVVNDHGKPNITLSFQNTEHWNETASLFRDSDYTLHQQTQTNRTLIKSIWQQGCFLN